MDTKPLAVVAANAPAKVSTYPEPFASRIAGRVKRPLGDLFGLKAFGVNLTRLRPGSVSSLHHLHSLQDEFVYVLEGEATLIADSGEVILQPGMCAGFAAGGDAHHVENRSSADVVFLEVGDRPVGDECTYPADDLKAVKGEDGRWRPAHKDGRPY